MNFAETGRVLAKAASYDRRTTGDHDVLAWQEALSDLDVAECLAAVAAHYRETTDWLMPAHVRRLVARACAAEQGRINAERDEELRLQIERVPTKDRSAEVAVLLATLRDKLGPGKPDLLRRPEVLEWERANLRRDRAAGYDESNPAFEGYPAPPDEDTSKSQPSEVEQS